MDIVLHSFAFRGLYLKDTWSIADIIVIALSIILVCLDLTLSDDSKFKGVLKIRGVFRLLRIFILFRKLNTVRAKKDNWHRHK